TMEGDEVRRVCYTADQRRNVAVADENLRMRNDPGRIKRRRQVIRTISSTRTNNRADIVAHEHVFQFPRPALRRTGKVKIAFQDRLEVKRLIAGTTKAVAARLQHFALHVRCGRDDSTLSPGRRARGLIREFGKVETIWARSFL